MLAVAGCGGRQSAPPRLPADLAREFAARSDHVAELLAAGDGCGARATADGLSASVVEAINAGRVPTALQEELGGAAAALAARIACVPPAPAPVDTSGDEKRPGGKHGRGKGKHDD